MSTAVGRRIPTNSTFAPRTHKFGDRSFSYRFGVIAAYRSNFGHFAFLSLLWGQPVRGGRPARTTYDDHLGLTGKHVVDFLLVLIELFSLGVTTETLLANISSKSAISLQLGPVDLKFQVAGVAPPTIFLPRKLG